MKTDDHAQEIYPDGAFGKAIQHTPWESIPTSYYAYLSITILARRC